jgi:Fe-S-cluster formation regulator IscX/YfhJ
MGVPHLGGDAQRLDVRFIQFDDVVIELPHYRDAEQPAGQRVPPSRSRSTT